MGLFRSAAAGVLLSGAGLALFACGSDDLTHGELAVWELQDPAQVTADTEVLEIGVSRLACAGGETGPVADVSVEFSDDQISIQAYTEALEEDGADCPDNKVVAETVDLGEPIGERIIVDGACENDDAARTTFCDSEIRWSESH